MIFTRILTMLFLARKRWRLKNSSLLFLFSNLPFKWHMQVFAILKVLVKMKERTDPHVEDEERFYGVRFNLGTQSSLVPISHNRDIKGKAPVFLSSSFNRIHRPLLQISKGTTSQKSQE